MLRTEPTEIRVIETSDTTGQSLPPLDGKSGIGLPQEGVFTKLSHPM